MKTLLFGILLIGSMSSFAKETLTLTCATKIKNTMSTATGYIVWEGVNFEAGKPVPHTTLNELKKGKIVSTTSISSTKVLNAIDSEELALFQEAIGEEKAKKIKTARYVNISDNGAYDLNLVNGFDKKGANLGGFIFSPMAGLVQKCFPINL